MKDLLLSHLNSKIGINANRAYRIDEAELIAVEDQYFTVKSDEDGITYHVPYFNIVKLMEHPEGVVVGGLFQQHRSFPFVVKIGHVVEYVPS
ncbi:hypothetical protein NHH03_18975 [Stieleria sp. TO1_6]|uniref:hypothetical protein n=1 Tax=Stieleria tagensis TaxID=2956795 RepID=UPI00209AC9CF|nr:hypothetical protein [Stieleria tagensis]MCO8123836.1 hypothetical protein [Stieleria tagensis]